MLKLCATEDNKDTRKKKKISDQMKWSKKEKKVN